MNAVDFLISCSAKMGHLLEGGSTDVENIGPKEGEGAATNALPIKTRSNMTLQCGMGTSCYFRSYLDKCQNSGFGFIRDFPMPTRPTFGSKLAHRADMSSAKRGDAVYIIDDESEARRSLHFFLSTIGLVSWPFASAQDFLDNLVALEPAPILLNIRMPGVDGLELMSEMRNRGINWPIIITSAHGDIQLVVKAVKLGAIEFLEKPFAFEALDTCLQSAFAQLAQRKHSFAARNEARSAFALLSTRETEVINMLMRGMPNKTAAHMLELSVRTVEMHRANALTKLTVKSIAEVIRMAHTAELGTINYRVYDPPYAQ